MFCYFEADKNLPSLSDRKCCEDSENAIENFVKFIFHRVMTL